MKYRLLLVDDVPNNIMVAGNILRKMDYSIVFATNGKEALDRVKKNDFDLILLDIMMPDMDGFEVCRKLKSDPSTRDIPIIFLTAKMDTESIVEAYDAGGQDFVTKPFNETELQARIKVHLELSKSHEKLKNMNDKLQHEINERMQLEEKIRKTNEELEKRVKERTAELQKEVEQRKITGAALEKTNNRLNDLMFEIILTMARLVEVRDPYTAGHQQRVWQLAHAIAEEMKLEQNSLDALRAAAIVHDLGKMYIPSEILSKPGKLEPVEFEFLKLHPRKGYEILKSIDFPWPVAEIVYQHHERIDGTGYPNGLKGDKILPEAKIIAVADVVEAISSHRPYRPSLGTDFALEQIQKERGVSFEADVVDACLNVFEKGFGFQKI